MNSIFKTVALQQCLRVVFSLYFYKCIQRYAQMYTKVNSIQWYGKTRVTSYELRATSYELRVESLKVRVESLKVRVESLKARVEIQKCEFKSTSYELKSTSYGFASTSYEFESTSSRIIKLMKTQVNSLKSSSFSKIISPKLFGNSWGNLYVQFLMIISCFTFSLLRGYGWVSKH